MLASVVPGYLSVRMDITTNENP